MNRREEFKYRDDYKISIIDEKYLKTRDVYCSHFGCGKKLSLIEQLCGNKCAKHSIKVREIF